jgi:hypothetical protein
MLPAKFPTQRNREFWRLNKEFFGANREFNARVVSAISHTLVLRGLGRDLFSPAIFVGEECEFGQMTCRSPARAGDLGRRAR